jgi:hypothetical protein
MKARRVAGDGHLPDWAGEAVDNGAAGLPPRTGTARRAHGLHTAAVLASVSRSQSASAAARDAEKIRAPLAGHDNHPVADALADLERGRKLYADGAWRDAYESLAGVDQATPLGADDLELLARAAYMLGRDDDYVSGLERAHHAHLDAGEALPAVRCAFWIGHSMLSVVTAYARAGGSGARSG